MASSPVRCALPLLIAVSSLSLALASDGGTWLQLYNAINPTSTTTNYWFNPDPRSYCIDLPAGFKVKAGTIYWNLKQNSLPYKYTCSYVWFFYGPGCTGGAQGIQAPALKTPYTLQSTTDTDYSKKSYKNVVNGVSIGCSFTPDPCNLFPCPANSVCSSSLGWNWQGTASQTFNCICNSGYVKVSGQCVSISSQCSKLTCSGLATCAADSSAASGVSCQCISSACIWTTLTNQQRVGLTSYTWNSTVAANAQSWANSLVTANGCTLAKSTLNGVTYQENDALASSEAAAVSAWMETTTYKVPRQRILSTTSTQLGCAGAWCPSSSAFVYVCYYSPL